MAKSKGSLTSTPRPLKNNSNMNPCQLTFWRRLVFRIFGGVSLFPQRKYVVITFFCLHKIVVVSHVQWFQFLPHDRTGTLVEVFAVLAALHIGVFVFHFLVAVAANRLLFSFDRHGKRAHALTSLYTYRNSCSVFPTLS